MMEIKRQSINPGEIHTRQGFHRRSKLYRPGGKLPIIREPQQELPENLPSQKRWMKYTRRDNQKVHGVLGFLKSSASGLSL